MNICLVSRYYPPVVGGIEAHVYNLATEFLAQGHDVTVLTSYSSARNSENGADRPYWVREVKGAQIPKLRALSYVWQGRRALSDALGSQSFDIVHWHDLYLDSIVTRVARKRSRLIFTNHSSHFLHWYESPLKKRLLRPLVGHADAFIAPSQELAAKTRDVLVEGSVVRYIPNGVDVGRFVPPKQEVDGVSEALTILCPRRLDPKNGVEYFVRAVPLVLARVPGCQFRIAGSGSSQEFASLRSLAIELGVEQSIDFVGPVAYDNMPDLVSQSDIVVIPSLMEATSLACLEAMACARPVVATRVGGLPELIDHGKHGLIVSERSVEELAAGIIRLCKNVDERNAFGNNSRTRVVSEFSWNVIAGKTLELYREAGD